MRQLSIPEVHARKIAELGLDPDALDLATPEGVSAAIRRAAGYVCPCTPSTLTRAVLRPLGGIVSDADAVDVLVEETLEAMVAHGDLLEESDVVDQLSPTRLLYAAPPSFVARRSGTMILLGVAPDHASALPEDLASRVEYVGHVRRIAPTQEEDLRLELRQLGLVELTEAQWLRSPPTETPALHLAAVDRLLDEVVPSRDIAGLKLLDPERPVRYYPARWVTPKDQTGRYVARRTQGWGADLWCYVEVRNGQPERMIDLPLAGGRWRGCDDAWRLQMAMDAQRGHRQLFRVREGAHGALLQLLSPVPAWARRRWTAIGEPVQSSGCLFAYSISKSEIDEERRYAREILWLEETNDAQRTP